jgi:nitrous oxide reductase accessory protein NosL
VRAHLVTINKLFEAAKAGAQPGTVFGVGDLFLMDMVHKAPDVIFDIIALACDETEYGATARKLPAGIQFKALQAVAALTLEDIGGPKALVAFLDVARKSQSLVGELAMTQ